MSATTRMNSPSSKMSTTGSRAPVLLALTVRGPPRGGRRPGPLIGWGRGVAVGSAICVTKSRKPRIIPRKLLSDGLSRLASSPRPV
jgi:hypothetical protein